MLRCQPASQEQTLSGTGARVYTAHRGWLGVVMGISAASTGGVLVIFTRAEKLTGGQLNLPQRNQKQKSREKKKNIVMICRHLKYTCSGNTTGETTMEWW